MSWALSELLGVGAIKGGVIPIAIGGVDLRRFFTFLDQLSASQEPLDADVFSDGGAGGLLKSAAKLGTADEEFIAENLQIQFLMKIFVDVLDDGLLHSAAVLLHGAIGEDSGDLPQQQDQVCKDHCAVTVGSQHSLETGIVLHFVEILPVVQIQRTGLPAEEGTDQSALGINGRKQGSIEIDDHPFIGGLRIHFDTVGFCRSHQENVTLGQGIGIAFDMKSAAAGKKKVDLCIGVGMHGEMVRQGAGIYSAGNVDSRTGIME